MNAMKSVVSASFCLAATLAAGVAGAESRTVGDVDGLFAAVADASVVEVVLTAKTYEIAEPLRLKRAVTVRSESGVPEDVIIHQTTTSVNTSSDETGQLGRCFYIDHAQAFVSGLTIENGNCSDNRNGRAGGNVFITANGGTVSNCVIRNGRGLSNWGSGGGGVGMYGGSSRTASFPITRRTRTREAPERTWTAARSRTRSSPAMRSTVAALRTTAAL